MLVGKHLHLHMARRQQGPLDQHAGIAESGQCFGTGAAQGLGKISCLRNQAHPASATTCHRLDHHGKTNGLGLALQRCVILVGAFISGQARHLAGTGEALRLGLAAQRADRGGRRADPDQPRILHGLGEVGVLAQEAIARMNGIGAGGRGGLQQLVDAQIAVCGTAPAQRVAEMRLAHMHGAGIGIGEDGNGLDAHGMRRAHDAPCDLATIGNQNALHPFTLAPSCRQCPSPC
ncbi:hypothetical protein D9M68_600800 [compost metagenome]